MPLYEYSCPACGHQFEELIRSADADTVACPKCGKRAKREFSTFSAAAAPDRSPAAAPPSCHGCPGGSGGACPYK